MTATIQWRGSVEALAEDLRTIVPPGEWPNFLALFVPRTEPRPMPAYLASLPQGHGARDRHGHPPRSAPISQLSDRARRALTALYITEPRGFARLTWLDFLKVDGCGTKTRAELLRWAGEYGAHLIECLPKREHEAIAAQRRPTHGGKSG